MIFVKVINDDGWQNGDVLHPKGKTLELDCTADRIQPYLDAGVLEVVKAISEPDKDKLEEEKIKGYIDTAVKAASELIIKTSKNPSITVKDRSDDDPKGGFKSLADFAKTIWMADHPDKFNGNARKTLNAWDMKTTGHMEEGEPAEGGHLVPPEFSTTLLQTSIENAIVRPRATFVPMQTNSIGFPALNDYNHSSNGAYLFGALAMYRPGEADQKTASKPKFDKITLTLHKGTFLTYVSDELMEDSPISIEPLLQNLFGKGLAWHQDNDYINGTGVNMPLGVLAAPCTIAKTRDPADGYLSYADVCGMWSRLHPASMANSVWLINNSLLPYLYQMCIICTGSDGSDLSGTPVYVPASGASESPYGTLFGRPVIVTEHCSAAGTTGDIILADWSQYLIGGKAGGGPKYDSSIHLRFDYDETAFRAVLRYDGQPWWKSALTPKHGSSTLSPFVVLATKS